MNTYGSKFRVTTYGESHGPAVGAVIDGCPAGITLDMQAIDAALARRRTGAPRQEPDIIEWLSGTKTVCSPENKVDILTLGTPIAFLIHNRDTRPDDYTALRNFFRPGHADYTYYMKYGIRDHRGGGRASARETVARVVAGAIALQLMPGVTISTAGQTPDAMPEGDTYGGTVTCTVTGVPAGIGEPVFGKLNAELAAAMMSIPSAIGFEMGVGFSAADMKGSEFVDRWSGIDSSGSTDNRPTLTNHCGGVQGGISNGMPIVFKVAFHPVVTLPQPVECLHEDGHLETITITGRHDRCHVQRAAAVVEAMTALCLVNMITQVASPPAPLF